MSFLSDLRWMLNINRARRIRNKLLFSQRILFDSALRPMSEGSIIAYPDAIYNITSDDVIRAGLIALLTKEQHHGMAT